MDISANHFTTLVLQVKCACSTYSVCPFCSDESMYLRDGASRHRLTTMQMIYRAFHTSWAKSASANSCLTNMYLRLPSESARRHRTSMIHASHSFQLKFSSVRSCSRWSHAVTSACSTACGGVMNPLHGIYCGRLRRKNTTHYGRLNSMQTPYEQGTFLAQSAAKQDATNPGVVNRCPARQQHPHPKSHDQNTTKFHRRKLERK